MTATPQDSIWDRLCHTHPTLRPGVKVFRRHFRSRRAYVVHDPVANQFFRLDPVSYHFVGLLDGRHTVEDSWRLTIDRFADSAPTQAEVVGLLNQLTQINLLATEGGADGEQLLRRTRRRRARRARHAMIRPLFIRIPLIDPAPAIEWLWPFVRPPLSWWALLLWAAAVLAAAVQLTLHFETFQYEALHVLRPVNLPWLVLVFVVVKVAHEFGHGLVCRGFGGSVHEMGIMMLVFAPVPYCDATSSWGLRSRGQRAMVALAGIVIELGIAATAVTVWAHTTAGTLHALAFNTILIAGVAALLINANPLLRFDGYYVLSDALDIPNLYQRANLHVLYTIQRHVFGLIEARPIASATMEAVWLSAYFMASWTYRVIVLTAIIWFVAGQLFGLGILLAGTALLTWLVLPLLRYLRWLALGARLAPARARAVAVNILVLAVVAILVGLFKVPEHTRAEAVIELTDWSELITGAEGFVQQILAADGDDVVAGQTIVICTNSQLVSERRATQATVDELRIRRADARENDVAVARIFAGRIAWCEDQLVELDRRIEALQIKSPAAGRILAPRFEGMHGRFVARGEVLGIVRRGGALRATAVLDQNQNAWLADPDRLKSVALRTIGRPGQSLGGTLTWRGQAAQSQLPHTLLGAAGGGRFATETNDMTGRSATESFFLVHVAIDDEVRLQPGQRAIVRFTFKPRPLARQWWRMLQQSVKR